MKTKIHSLLEELAKIAELPEGKEGAIAKFFKDSFSTLDLSKDSYYFYDRLVDVSGCPHRRHLRHFTHTNGEKNFTVEIIVLVGGGWEPTIKANAHFGEESPPISIQCCPTQTCCPACSSQNTGQIGRADPTTE